MQQPLRLLSKNGGTLGRAFFLPRGIHTSSTAAIALSSCRDGITGGNKAEISSNDLANSARSISTGAVANAGFTTGRLGTNQMNKLPNLGPRAKAGFNTSIARKDLGFLPFESSIIFPTMDFAQRNEDPEIRVPYLPDNLHPARPPEPEYRVARPIITTVSDTCTHIAAPSAIIEGIKVDFSFLREQESESNQSEEDIMMRAFRGI